MWRGNKCRDKSGLMSRLGMVANARTQHLQWMADATRSSWLCWEDIRLTTSTGESEATSTRLTLRHWLTLCLACVARKRLSFPVTHYSTPVKNKGKLTRAMALEMNHKHPSSRCPWVLGRGSLFMSCFSERLYAIECAHLGNMYWSFGHCYGAVQMGQHQKGESWGKELIHGSPPSEKITVFPVRIWSILIRTCLASECLGFLNCHMSVFSLATTVPLNL